MIRPVRARVRKDVNGFPVLNRNPAALIGRNVTALGGGMSVGPIGGTQPMGSPGAFTGGIIDDGPRQIPTEGVATGFGEQAPVDIQMSQAPQQRSQFGLSGAESAVMRGVEAGSNALERGLGLASQNIGSGIQGGMGQINQGIASLLSGGQSAAQNVLRGTQSALGQISNARSGAMNQLNMARGGAERNIGQGIDAFRAGESRGLGAIRGSIQQGVDPLQGFIDPGRQAQQSQAALSGALGPEAQAQAFNQFTESPGQGFLREQGQNAIINQAAATGGLGGGNVLRELQRQGQGLAAQDLQNQFNRLGQVTGTGLQAAGQVGQLRGQQAGLESNLIGNTASGIAGLRSQGAGIESQLGQAGAGIQSQLGQVGAGIQQQGSSNIANLLRGTSQDISQLRGQGANMEFQGGSQLGNLSASSSGQAANMFDSAGRFIGGQRIQAGRDIANQIGATTQGLSGLANQQGINLSNQLGQGANTIANILSGAGTLSAEQQERLAALLTNQSVGQASSAQQSGQSIGQTAAAGAAAQGQQQSQTGGMIIGALASLFSDCRLKDDIEHLYSENGFNFYKWNWNDKMPIKSMAGKLGMGVLAQEVNETNPELISVSDGGYLMVNYDEVFKLCH